MTVVRTMVLTELQLTPIAGPWQKIEALFKVRTVTSGRNVRYMILIDNVFRHEMRPPETQVPLTFLKELMTYSTLQVNSCRCTW